MNKLVDETGNFLSSVGDTTMSLGSNAGDLIGQTTDNIITGTGNMLDSTGNLIGDTTNNIITGTGDVINSIGQGTIDSTKSVLEDPASLFSFGAETRQKFYNLMIDFNIVGFALGLIIVGCITELTNAFIEGVVMPTMEPIIDKYKLNSEDDPVIKFGPFIIHYTRFLKPAVKFFVLSLIIFIAIGIGLNLSKPVQWVSVRSVANNARL